MPKLLHARPPVDAYEEHQVCRLARSHHAPADWVLHARMILRSWAGARTATIAAELRCHSQTVRERIQAWNAHGLDGLRRRPGSGRKPRLSDAERSALIALVQIPPPSCTEGQAHARSKEPEWTLDSLTAAARAQGIQVARSQLRSILLGAGVRWRKTRLGAMSRDAHLTGTRHLSSPTTGRPASRWPRLIARTSDLPR
jgi:transposase